MADWKERFVERARTDDDLMLKLFEIARLDSECMPGTGITRGGQVIGWVADNRKQMGAVTSRDWQSKAMRLDSLCDEVAEKVAAPGEDAGEIAQWISYNCQEVAQEIDGGIRQSYLYQYEMPRKMLIWFLVSLALGVGAFFLAQRYWHVWWQSLSMAILMTVVSFFAQARIWASTNDL